MFCKHCGKQIDSTVNFCPYCGASLARSKGATDKQGDAKTYRSVFWKFLWAGVLLNIFERAAGAVDNGFMWLLALIAVAVYVYLFAKTINEAMLSVGKKNWWSLGLLALVPLGYWIAFFVVRSKLKPAGWWDPISEPRSKPTDTDKDSLSASLIIVAALIVAALIIYFKPDL